MAHSKLVISHLEEPTSEQLLALIFRYIARIPAERDLDRLLLLFADLGRELVSAHSCTVWLIDPEKDLLWSRVSHELGRVTIPRDRGIAGEVSRTGKSILLNDPYHDPRFAPDIDHRFHFHTRNLMALPLVSSTGHVMGVLQVVNKRTSQATFSALDLERLALASTYTAMEIEAAILGEEMANAEREIILTLAETGEMRSRETGQHVQRVAEYTEILATASGLPLDEVARLKIAVPLHDIGKIAIPDAILLKPGPLTSEELRVIKTHADLGYEILRHSGRLIIKAAAIISSQHHEKWDGSGYPRGFAGEDIHLYGRITAIGDVFDALGSERCYKKAWPVEKVLNYMDEQSGKHFDPSLIRLFQQNLDLFLVIQGHP